MNRWIVILSGFAIVIMISFPFIIGFRFKLDAQWIGFFSSYSGGIFGGIVSGGLTLGGVYLTVLLQRRLLVQEKFKKIGYVYAKLIPRFWSLNVAIQNEREMNLTDQINYIKSMANNFIKIIEDNMHIIKDDFDFLRHIETITRRLDDIVNYNFEKSDQKILEDLTLLNNQIQIEYKRLQDYERSLHKRAGHDD